MLHSVVYLQISDLRYSRYCTLPIFPPFPSSSLLPFSPLDVAKSEITWLEPSSLTSLNKKKSRDRSGNRMPAEILCMSLSPNLTSVFAYPGE